MYNLCSIFEDIRVTCLKYILCVCVCVCVCMYNIKQRDKTFYTRCSGSTASWAFLRREIRISSRFFYKIRTFPLDMLKIRSLAWRTVFAPVIPSTTRREQQYIYADKAFTCATARIRRVARETRVYREKRPDKIGFMPCYSFTVYRLCRNREISTVLLRQVLYNIYKCILRN